MSTHTIDWSEGAVSIIGDQAVPPDQCVQYVIGCEHCGRSHVGACPRIKAIEYHENGQIKRVEYKD